MDIQIIEKEKNHMTLRTGKTTAYIAKSKYDINVICKNASHLAWKSAGRFFETFDQAAAGYKSGAMKSMINFAAKELA